jgi:YD repeat-containing protein
VAWFRIRKLSRLVALILGAVLACFSLVSAQTIIYVYDELGRLVGIIDPSQGTAVYQYDSVGNITAILRYAANAVVLIEFTPNRGPVNTTVTLSGTGFSTTPSQNTVKFNGITATVTSSTATSIVTKVPTGATTGPISVTTPTGSATSATNFVVAANSGAPTVTSFSPAIATPGMSTTITGTSFDPALANDKVTFNGLKRTDVTSATATSLVAVVPQYPVGSGRVTVTTPIGAGTSGADFFIPPSPYVVSDVQVTGRMSSAVAKTITISTQQKIALLVFDGTAGQGMQLELSAMTIPQLQVSIYQPNGTLFLAPTTIVAPGAFVKITSLPATGTYTVLVAPVGTGTGNATLKFGAPDLVITAVTVPTTPISALRDGTYQFAVTWTGKNQGNVNAQPNWFDRLYLSTNTTLDGNDTVIGGNTYQQVLAPNATYNLGWTATVPAIAAGTYYVLVEADSASPGAVPESNEANNVKASSAITLLGLPDLTVATLTIPAGPIGPNRDGTYSLPISYTVNNLGQSTPQQGWSDGIYLSTDATWDAGDARIWSQQQNIDVLSGTGYTNTPTAVAPVGQAPGDYYVIAFTDYAAFLAETNETNNTKVSATRVTLLPLPDLTPTSLIVPTSPIPNNGDGTHDVTITFTVTNQGPSDAQPYWYDFIYLSIDAVLDGGDPAIAAPARSTVVPAGTGYTVTLTQRVSASVAPGDYYVILNADNNLSLAESNEGNNVLVSATRITLAP